MSRELNLNELEAVSGGLTKAKKQNLLDEFNSKKTDIDYDYDFDPNGCRSALENLKNKYVAKGLSADVIDRIIRNENYVDVYNSLQDD